MTTFNQKVLALDTKFSKHRGGNVGSDASATYLKRRLQLLASGGGASPQDCHCCKETNTPPDQVRACSSYLQLRAQLLRRQVKKEGRSSDLESTTSFSFTTGEVRAPGKSVTFREEQGGGGGGYDFCGFHLVSDQHRAPVTRLLFLHNSASTLVTSSLDSSLSVLHLETGGERQVLQGHEGGVTDCDISTSNELVVSSSMDGTVCLWRLADSKLVRTLSSTPRCPLLCVRFLPGNNNLLVTGGEAGFVQITNVSTGTFPPSGTSSVAGKVLCLAVSPQGDALVWAGTDRSTILAFRVDCKLGALRKGHRTVVAEQGGAVTSLSFRPPVPGAGAGTGTPLLLANCGRGQLVTYQVTDSLGALQLHRTFSIVHTNRTIRSTFAPLINSRSGECVVSASEDGAVYFFDVSRASKACINKLEAHSCPGIAVAFNFNETYLATSDNSGLVIVWKR